MTIEPDTKDWTWVLERPCPECGFDVNSFPRERVGQVIRNTAAEWERLLRHPNVRRRPRADRWSGLEYACHVRDVFLLYDERLQLMLEIDGPGFQNWDQDAAAIEGRYGDQAPETVGKELVDAADRLAARFDSVTPAAWGRTGRRSDGANFTIESFARYLVHDPVHHVHDVERGYRLMAGDDSPTT